MPNGVNFPKQASGKRSTQEFGRQCIGAALDPLSKADGNAARDDKKWRFKYVRHFIKMVQLGLAAPDNAVASSQAGLDFIKQQFVFVEGERETPLAEYMASVKEGFHTGIVRGNGSPSYCMPYQGKNLAGSNLNAQVDKWVKYGTIEADAGAAIKRFAAMSDQERQESIADHYFVLLGAGSAMGPFKILMDMGATVVAVDLDRPGIWKRLLDYTKNSPGTLVFPLKQPEAACGGRYEEFAGSNLLTQPAQIANWLCGLTSKPNMMIGAYAYLDGELFVRLSVAMDSIIAKVIESRMGHNLTLPALAYLCTPTDVHAVLPEVAADARKNLKAAPAWMTVFGMLGKNFCRPNKMDPVVSQGGPNLDYQNNLVAVQGPNYALAKRVQHWRAVVARKMGCVVSSNVAPSTATVSVTHNRSIALAYEGFRFFKPLEVFQQDTSNAVMAAIMVNDLTNPKSAANPSFKLSNPLMLFAYTSAHGGAHRNGFTMGSIGEAAAAAYVLSHPVALAVYVLISVLILKVTGYV